MSKTTEWYENPFYTGFINEKEYSEKTIAKHRKQYEKRGFDDSELWSLDVTIAKFILPRLKRFKTKAGYGCHGGENCPFETTEDGFMTQKGWGDCIQKMIDAFQVIVDDCVDDSQQEVVDEGLALFAKYFQALWL